MRCSICGITHSNRFIPTPDGIYIHHEFGLEQTLCKPCEMAWLDYDDTYILEKIKAKIIGEHEN